MTGGVTEVVACLANGRILLGSAHSPIGKPMMTQVMTRALQLAEFHLYGT